MIHNINFGLLHIVSFEFEYFLYLSECTARVVWYTQYIVDITQDVLVLLKAVGFNRKLVPYVRFRLGRQESSLTIIIVPASDPNYVPAQVQILYRHSAFK